MTPDDLFDYVLRQHRRGETHLRKEDLEADCPYCGGHRKFAVNLHNGRHGCFRCPDAFGHLGQVMVSRRSEWARLSRDAGAPDRFRPERISGAREGISLPGWTVAGISAPLTPAAARAAPFPSLVRRVYDYCIDRGMTPEQILRYRVAAVPYVLWAYFPVWDARGVITFYMGRAIDGAEPKTLEPGTEKPLFGSHVFRPPPGGVINLVEGVFDHFQTPDSFATMGTNLSERHIDALRLLKPAWVNVVWDPDAYDKARRAASLLWRAGVRAQAVRITGDKDPGDLGRAIMSRVVASASQERPPMVRALTCSP